MFCRGNQTPMCMKCTEKDHKHHEIIPIEKESKRVKQFLGNLLAKRWQPEPLHLQETPQKVGIFLDFEEGVVSFYDAEANTQIYTYSGCAFTEPLYPYLNPCLHDNGKNTAPLIICPVE
eukprot:superscaffoldBa00005944_g20962